jgi:hypothetical protein
MGVTGLRGWQSRIAASRDSELACDEKRGGERRGNK